MDPNLDTAVYTCNQTRYAIAGGICLYLHHTASNAIHGSFHIAFHLVPVGPPFRKLVYFFHTPDALEPTGVRNDRCQFLRIGWIDQVNLRQLAEGFEVKKKFTISERLNELEVVIHVAAERQQGS